MKYIQLTQGKRTKVDDEDYDYLTRWNWYFKQGYACRNQYKPEHVTIRMHRVINKTPEGMLTDHKNGDKLDNRRSNLRECTPSDNLHNTPYRSTNASGYKNIYWHKRDKRWRVQASANYKKIYIGDFKELEEARAAYRAYILENHGEFAKID